MLPARPKQVILQTTATTCTSAVLRRPSPHLSQKNNVCQLFRLSVCWSVGACGAPSTRNRLRPIDWRQEWRVPRFIAVLGDCHESLPRENSALRRGLPGDDRHFPGLKFVGDNFWECSRGGARSATPSHSGRSRYPEGSDLGLDTVARVQR